MVATVTGFVIAFRIDKIIQKKYFSRLFLT